MKRPLDLLWLVGSVLALLPLAGCLPDQDGDGYPIPFDCDDQNPDVHPGAPEVCDGIDNNCDGSIDEGVTRTFYPDADNDGYGASGSATQACTAPAGYVDRDDDCDDQDSTVHPGAPEACDAKDNDCDHDVDEGFPENYFRDADQDGFGADADSVCAAKNGYIPVRGDCDDTDPSIHAGAPDPAGDGIDQDCGGTDEPDPSVGLEASTYASIQAALDAALARSTVWVGPGTYDEHGLTFRGKPLMLSSTHGAEQTVVDAQAAGSVMVFDQLEGPGTMVCGLTLTGGSAPLGSGIYLLGSNPTLMSMIIRDNHTSNASSSLSGGAGMYLEGASPTLTFCTLAHNDASSAGGGGIYMTGSSIVLTRCTLSGNMAGFSSGGGMYLEDSSARLTGCDLIENSVGSGDGGGISASGSSLEVIDTLFARNTLGAGNGGGAVGLFHGSSGTFLRCRMSENSVGDAYGGALHVSDSSATLTNCILDRNSGLLGGAVYSLSSSPVFVNDVVTGNRTTLGMGGVMSFSSGGAPQLVNSIVADNYPGNVQVDGSISIQIRYSDLYNPPGQDNVDPGLLDATDLTVEPGFLAYDSSGLPVDFHLALGSPLIDAGDPALLDVDGSRSDMGAYGGPQGGGLDIDHDGVPDYFWPGTIDDAPAGFHPADWDCDDLDPTLRTCL